MMQINSKIKLRMKTGRIRVHIPYINGIWRGWKLMEYLRTKIVILMILLN